MIKQPFFRIAAATALVLAAGAASALPPESVQLQNAQFPDVTPQQKYQTMLNEAHGGLKVNLEACRSQPAANRSACTKEAQALFQKDMAAARAILRNPAASTSVAIRSDIRTTETPVAVQ
jgi:hypothetical protein